MGTQISRWAGRSCLTWGLALAVIFVCTTVAFGADVPEWSAGVASVKITPPQPVVLAGYANRTKPMEGVAQDIYAKALALKDAAGSRAVLITIDICHMPRDVGEGLRARISGNTHIDPAAVLLSVSHTHSGPSISLHDELELGAVFPTSAGTVEYTHWLMDRLVEVAEKAVSDVQPAMLSWGTGFTSFAMNRREYTDKGVIIGNNPRGLVDRSVPVLRIDSPDGKALAVLFGYACHNTTNQSDSLLISGDYAGYAKAYVEEQTPGCQAMFMMGCGGDTNPFPRKAPADTRANGEQLGKEVCRVLGDKLRPIHAPLKCVIVPAELPILAPDRDSLQRMVKTAPKLQKPIVERMLQTVDGGGKLPTTYPAPVGAWQFGNDLTMITLPEEVVVGYVPRIEDAIGATRLWTAAYCHEVCGYVPTRKILEQGGYEARGLYTGVGLFDKGVEDALVNAAKEAAVQAGRKVDGKTQ